MIASDIAVAMMVAFTSKNMPAVLCDGLHIVLLAWFATAFPS
jgi:hypothetical protein